MFELYSPSLDIKHKFPHGVCNCSRQWSSLTGTKKVDFTDLTRPHTWYPIARRKKRNVVLHVSPTNSGKTHHALKQLQYLLWTIEAVGMGGGKSSL
nr:ATP-dependent RNA helicase SUV3, mitochondrial isoform X1 [Ipomoea batatas]